MAYPKRGDSYFARTILNEKEMELPDTPFFTFTHDGRNGTIQTSHCTVEQLLEVPGFADTLWVYQYTTREEIPIFKWDTSRNASTIENFVDIAVWEDEPDEWWVTPKGLPREQ